MSWHKKIKINKDCFNCFGDIIFYENNKQKLCRVCCPHDKGFFRPINENGLEEEYVACKLYCGLILTNIHYETTLH